MTGVVDCHVHIEVPGQRMRPEPHGVAEYGAATAGLGLTRYGAMVMAPPGDLAETRARNDAVLAVPIEDARAYALCSVHPEDGDAALAEIDRVAELGARGLKLHPNSQMFDVGSDDVRAVVQRAGERGLPVLFDSMALFDPGQPEKFVLLSVQCPDARLVLAHTFGPKFPQAVTFSTLTRFPGAVRNVYLELSAIATIFGGSPFTEQVAWICRNHGLDRVLWGSDYPLFDPAESLAALRTFGFSDGELAQVTSGTARELYGL